ncbi:TetR-like C-terminal domain-containing protein [Streptomyces sp. NPDC058171]
MPTSLVDTLEAARDTAAHDDPAGRLLSWARAFRERALADPEGFRLIYGDPVPGYAAPEAQRRTCSRLAGLVAAAWARAEARQPRGDHQWSECAPHLVALEVHGHLRHQTREPESRRGDSPRGGEDLVHDARAPPSRRPRPETRPEWSRAVPERPGTARPGRVPLTAFTRNSKGCHTWLGLPRATSWSRPRARRWS